MKKGIVCLMALILLCTSFTGCSRKAVASTEHLDEYVQTLPYHDGFTILQLTDIHWNSGTQIGDETYGGIEYLSKVITEAQNHAGTIDLIEITGDTFMLANKLAVSQFIAYIEKLEIPYAVTWGNHDRECLYNPDWLSLQFEEAEHSLYTEVQDDDLYGECNYVINLVDGNGNAVWQIGHLDSGASCRKSAADFFLTYDYIREDQLAWLAEEHKAAGDDVPMLCYYHIDQTDAQNAYELLHSGNSTAGYYSRFCKLEGFGTSDLATPTEDALLAMNVKGVFMGHCHNNDWTVTLPSGITYGFGVKSGTELYSGTVEAGDETTGFTVDETFQLIGASLVTLQDGEGNFTLEHLYYNEREDGDFVRWVNYRD